MVQNDQSLKKFYQFEKDKILKQEKNKRNQCKVNHEIFWKPIRDIVTKTITTHW